MFTITQRLNNSTVWLEKYGVQWHRIDLTSFDMEDVDCDVLGQCGLWERFLDDVALISEEEQNNYIDSFAFYPYVPNIESLNEQEIKDAVQRDYILLNNIGKKKIKEEQEKKSI